MGPYAGRGKKKIISSFLRVGQLRPHDGKREEAYFHFFFLS